VRFPCVPAPEAVQPEPLAAAPLAPQRILLIDDNEDLRRTIAVSLAVQGHQVTEAAAGRQALALAASVPLDVAVVDIGLPEMDGYEVARRLRRNPSTRHIRLIALTGYGQAEDKQKAVAAGFEEHLTKPVDPQTLERVIADTVRAAR
jgi:CheY-like chemotaxis protein